MDRGLHSEPAMRPWPEAAPAAAAPSKQKQKLQRIKSILVSSAALAELERAPSEEWVPMDEAVIAPQASQEPAADTTRLVEAKGGRLLVCSGRLALGRPRP